jgi:hypothetical protein
MSTADPSIAASGPTIRDQAPPSQTQPTVGVVGLLFAAVVVIVLGFLVTPMRSLQSFGILTTFILPVMVMVGLWWRGWPFHNLAQPLQGIMATLMMVGIALLLCAGAQAIVGRADLGDLLSMTPPPAPPAAGPPPPELPFTSYPWLLPLAGLVFISMLQLTFVNAQWPLNRLGRVGGGLVALIVACGIGLLAYLLLADWDPTIPAQVRPLLGLRNPNGPVDAIRLVGATLCIAVWQVLLFIVLQGKPFEGVRPFAARVVVRNLVPIGLGWLTYLLLFKAFDWTIPTIAAVCGCIIGASILATLAFEAWPARLTGSDAGTAGGLLVTVAALAVVLFFGLKALGNAFEDWNPRDVVQLWVTVVALNLIPIGIITWYAIWHRWPMAPPAPPPDAPPPATAVPNAPGDAPAAGRYTEPSGPGPDRI